MNVLIVYNRDIDVNDAGASRTTIELANYLTEKQEVRVYVDFNILSGNCGKIIELPIKQKNVEAYKHLFNNYNIDCVIVPEAEKLTRLVCQAKEGKDIKIVSALHNKPGYERERLYISLKYSFFQGGLVTKIKVILCLLLYPLYFKKATYKIVRAIHDSYNFSDKFALLSERYFDSFVKKYHINDRKGTKLVSIPNGLSFGDEFIDLEQISKKENICLVVGRLDERQKRLSWVFQIWKDLENRFPDWKLQIVGSGPSEQDYKEIANRYKLKNVLFEGHQVPKPYYQKAKLFFMTSAYEGQPMTLLEAQPMGCVPVVIDSFEAVHDIIENGKNGYVVSNRNEFVEKANILMTDESKLREYAINGIQTSKKFERKLTYERYYNIIREFIV